MADKAKDVIHYTDYFNLTAPRITIQVLLFIIAGGIAGILSSFFILGSISLTGVLLGAGSGIMVITVPGFLTAILLKSMKRRIQMKHAMFATLAPGGVYALFIMLDAAATFLFKDYRIAYLLFIVINAGLYCYWFLINKVAIGQGKGSIFTAAIHPVLNILFFIPLQVYILNLGVSLDQALVKLYGGMIVFLAISYIILYLLDRPAKKVLNVSGVSIFSTMLEQWLYNFIKDTNVFGNTGTGRDVDVDIVAFKSGKDCKAVFVKPDIHYGPFSEIGGSVATQYLGNVINSAYGASPFVLHGAVNSSDNPTSSDQIREMGQEIKKEIDKIGKDDWKKVKGRISFGKSGPCRVINIGLGNLKFLALTKAPLVTEDIDREIGISFEKIAGKEGEVILIDAHNSRFESASGDELRGIYSGSKYVKMYAAAIQKSMHAGKEAPLRFGASCMKLSDILKEYKDVGKGFTSVAIFEFGKRRFCMVYFDSNNMLPGFREDIIKHIRKKFGLDVELFTTDTHSVNSIALPASNALGRQTQPAKILPVIDQLIDEAIEDLGEVRVAHKKIVFKGLRVWGSGAEESIIKASREVIRVGKRVVPFVIVAGFILAAWIIYII